MPKSVANGTPKMYNRSMSKLILSPYADVYLNLSCEETLFNSFDGEPTLYLWRNHDAIVIGRWQNAWKECDCKRASEDGVKIARRLTGGGAVFHDLGNLNFTFIVSDTDFDIKRQLGVIVSALVRLGTEAVSSGRNDITVNGLKISGNAFRKSGNTALHHGTLLVSGCADKMEKYLRPSPLKLAAKGVDSVRSRIGFLRDINSSIGTADLALSVAESFSEEYGKLRYIDFDVDRFGKSAEYFSSPDFVFGKNPPCSVNVDIRTSTGVHTVSVDVEKGSIARVGLYSDTLDDDLPDIIVNRLTGIRFNADGIRKAFINATDSRIAEFGQALSEYFDNKIFD